MYQPQNQYFKVTISLLAIIISGWIITGQLGTTSAIAQDIKATQAEENAIRRAEEISLAFQLAIRRITPSVVNITTIEEVTTRRTRRNDRGEMPEDLRDWLDRFGPPSQDDGDEETNEGDEIEQDEAQEPDDAEQEQERPRRRVPGGQGSGVIVRSDGYIVTNNHVVADAVEIRVTLNNGKEYKAVLVDGDSQTDLAVLKIEADDLIAARFADSDAAQVGQWVLAIGNPFGLDHSVSSGIISAKGRRSMGLAAYSNFIQTDAAVNPGNSGGPLVNLRGEVLGINNAIVTRNGSNQGIAFAIPSNMVNSVVTSVLRTGHVVRGWIGIRFRPITTDSASAFGYTGSSGIIVSSVVEQGPADAAGLRRGDIVIALDGRYMQKSAEFRNVIARSFPGTNLALTVFRSGKKRSVLLELGTRPSIEELDSDRYLGSKFINFRNFGLTVEELSDDLTEVIRFPGKDGVYVAAVHAGRRAHDAGLRAGDVIVKFDDVKIRNLQAVREAMRSYDRATSISVYRAGELHKLSPEN
ncbi:MAG: Do family serine endopeptidase [Planctomycetes bacterium]|nr:Do family serine endopeptidase [Planctomycetota bacterium]